MGWTITGVVFLIYLGTLSRHYSADSVFLALRIEAGQLGPIVDPTHLLIEPMGLAWYRLWQFLGWESGPLVLMQVVNAAVGALSVGLLYGIAKRLTGSQTIAGLTGAGFAFSGGMWLLSSEAETATIGLATSLLVLWLLLTPPQRLAGWRGYGLILGLAVSLAIYTFLSGAILIPIVGFGLLIMETNSGQRSGESVVMFVATVAAVCLPTAGSLLAYRSLPEWKSSVWQHGGQDYSALSLIDVPWGVYAFLRSLGLFPSLALNESTRSSLASAGNGTRITFVGYYGLLLLVALAPVYLAIRLRARIDTRWRHQVIILLLWMVSYAAFAIYWVPGDITFWLPVLSGWWLLVALIAEAIAEAKLDKISGVNRPVIQRPTTVLLVLVFLIAITNGAISILPRHDLASNDIYQMAMDVRERTLPSDLIVTNPDNIETLYLVYFGRRTVLPVAGEAPDPERLEQQFSELFLETTSIGGRPYLLQDQDLIPLTP